MKNWKSAFVLLFAMLGLTSCSSDDGEEGLLYRSDEDGYQYSPAELFGTVEYMPSMKPKSLRIVSVDGLLNPKDSFEIPLDSTDGRSYEFSVAERDYEYPFLKMVLVFPFGKHDKMEISQYIRLYYHENHRFLEFYGALISGRIETLVRQEKYKFADAESKAYEELEKELGISKNSTKNNTFQESNYWGDLGLYDMLPYVVCRHEISDSVFYSDYKEFRDTFAKKGKISESIKVRAADAWLSTFKMPSDSTQFELFKSESRDTSSCLKRVDTTFFKWAYGLDGSWADDSMQIHNELSKYDGRTFIYENISYRNIRNGWRLRTTIEDTLGACKYSSWDFAELGSNAYLCTYEEVGWKKLSDIDSIMNNKYVRCERMNSIEHGFIGTFDKTLYICSCESDESCGWAKIKEDYEAAELDSLSANIVASLRYGICRDHGGEKQLMDDVMMRCDWNKWRMVDSLEYFMGICNNFSNMVEYGKMPNGDYYKCKTYGGTQWEKVTALEANRVPCNSDNSNTYKEYEDRYYYCQGGKWHEVPKDSVVKSVESDG